MKQPTGKLLNLGKREKIQQANSTILIVVAVASVILSMSLVAGNFLLKQKSYNDRVYAEKKLARDTLRDNVVNAKTLEQKYNDIESSKSIATSKVILDALPANYDSPALRSSVEALAQRNSLTIESMQMVDNEGKVQESSLNPVPIDMPYAVSVVGNYGQIGSFLRDLERTIRQMNVKSVIMSGQEGRMKVEVSVVTQFQPVHEVGMTTREVQ